MSESPAFQVYPNDFLGSAKVGMMSTEEIGAYWLLLLLDWQEVGFVFEERALSRWCKLTPARFRKAWEAIKPCFVERDGRLFNPRLEREREKQAEWRRKSSEGGKKSAEARWGHTDKGGGKGGYEMVVTNGVTKGQPNGNTPLPSPVTTTTKATTSPASREDLRTATVFSRYKELHPDSRLSLKSADKTVRRAPKQYSATELVEAVEGNAADTWHAEQGKHELSYVLRGEEKIDHFRELRRRQLHPKLVGVGGDVTVEELAQMGIRL